MPFPRRVPTGWTRPQTMRVVNTRPMETTVYTTYSPLRVPVGHGPNLDETRVKKVIDIDGKREYARWAQRYASRSCRVARTSQMEVTCWSRNGRVVRGERDDDDSLSRADPLLYTFLHPGSQSDNRHRKGMSYVGCASCITTSHLADHLEKKFRFIGRCRPMNMQTSCRP